MFPYQRLYKFVNGEFLPDIAVSLLAHEKPLSSVVHSCLISLVQSRRWDRSIGHRLCVHEEPVPRHRELITAVPQPETFHLLVLSFLLLPPLLSPANWLLLIVPPLPGARSLLPWAGG